MIMCAIFLPVLFLATLFLIRMGTMEDKWITSIFFTFGIWCGCAFIIFLWWPHALGITRILFPY